MHLEDSIRQVVRQEITSALKDRGYASRAWVKALHLSRPRDFEDAELGLSRLERLNQRIETLEKQARKLFALNKERKGKAEAARKCFSSIMSITTSPSYCTREPTPEGTHRLLYAIAREAEKGYDLCTDLIGVNKNE